jgi:hypothetical protein
MLLNIFYFRLALQDIWERGVRGYSGVWFGFLLSELRFYYFGLSLM